MLSIDETIDTFRRGVLDIDCKEMVLTQRKEGGERFEGQGYIRQLDDGALTFKVYVVTHNAVPFSNFDKIVSTSTGKLYEDEAFYDLEAISRDGTRWTTKRILPASNWDATDMTVLMLGSIRSMTAHIDMSQRRHYLRLHFFEEYAVPLIQWSTFERYGRTHNVTDRAEFEAFEAKFEVQQRQGSGATTVEVTSETPLPVAFDLRVQEALQYLTAKSAFWRARLQSSENGLHLELSSPWRKSARTQFSPPISPGSYDFRQHGWRLFAAYLTYVIEKTHGMHWNSVAYHLHNACEATANSVDAWAVGISVAVEAVTGLIAIASDREKADELTAYQNRAFTWLSEQTDLSAEMRKRAHGQISAMGNKRPQDILYALATTGRVEKNYVNAWSYLRNRHVHPKLQDLEKPTPVDMQKLLDHIHKVEVLLRQLTFHLIGYEGPFTDYGATGFPSRQYPLAVE